MLKEILNPDLYHGNKKKKNFFEGWYYKITDKESKHSFAFIPGIIKGAIKEEGHSFIQVIDGSKNQSEYIKFTKDNFKASHKPFYVEIHNNHFSFKEIRLNHYDNHIQMVGTIKIVDIVKWPDSWLNPGSMGFYNYLCFMECYSQVCCLNGGIVGKLLINNEEIDFTGGKIYIEKNWGKSFPESYIWVQANNFLMEDAALTVSIGKVPFLFSHFNGFLGAFLLNKKIYKFTTMNHSQKEIEIVDNHNVLITLRRNDIVLTIETLCKDDDFINIKGPSNNKMSLEVDESIISEVRVELLDLNREKVLFQGISKNAGIEFMGDYYELRNKK